MGQAVHKCLRILMYPLGLVGGVSFGCRFDAAMSYQHGVGSDPLRVIPRLQTQPAFRGIMSL